MRIAILHDFFDKRGGGERLVLNLAKALKADIYTGFIDYDKTFEDASSLHITDIGALEPSSVMKKVALSKRFSSFIFPKYDIYIFSGVWCISAASRLKPNILYLHTPPRFLYDLKNHYLERMGIIEQQLAKLFIRYWRPKDQSFMKNFDKICPNSNNVKERIRKYYGENLYKKSTVVYTGFSTKDYKHKKSKNFFLCPHRLDPLKRIDLIIEAFKKIPNQKLVIAGSGPDEKRLMKLAEYDKNISFLGTVSKEEMLELYATCTATISANIDEDLGLVPLETHASGKPALVVKEGAFLETVSPKNGIFFSPNTSSLIEAVHTCEKTKWNPKNIQKSSQKYDTKAFTQRIKLSIKQAMNKNQ